MPHRLFGATVVAAVLVLAGCAEDPQPKVADPGPTAESSTVVSTPSASAAVDPQAVVTGWVEAQNEALRSGDLAQVRALSSPACRSCDGLIDPIEEIHAAGGFFVTDGWVIDRLKVGSKSANRATVNTAITIRGGRTVTATGEDPVLYDAEKRIVRFRLSKATGDWLVSFIGFL